MIKNVVLIDAFGDAYDYLMTMYVPNAVKSDGKFHISGSIKVSYMQ